MPPRTGTARSSVALGALPAALAGLCALLLRGAFATPHPFPWTLLIATAIGAVARWGLARQRKTWHALEDGLLCAVSVLALAQIAPPLQPLMYLLAAGYVLALPLKLALPLLGALLALDAALTPEWPQVLAHASFAALFAALYHGLLGARLAAARRAEKFAVRKRVADAEVRARELRLIAVSSDPPDAAERHLLAGVGEVEEVLRGALAIADAALRPHTIAVFLLSPDGESVRLRECASKSDRLFRGPLSSREGALGAVLSTQSGVRLEEGAAQLTYYEDRAPVPCFCGVPLQERGGRLIGALAADRATPFTPEDQRVLEALANEATRAVEAERLLGAVRKEKEEKARFFRALEELNKTTTLQQAAETAVAQARQMCGALDLCAVTLFERGRHRVAAVEGEATSALRELSFSENAGLVSNVVKLGAPLPGRPLAAMDRVQIFDGGTVVRGLAALKIFPLKAGDTVVGTLVCGSRDGGALPEAAQKELAMLGLQAAEALLRTRLYEQAERLATTDGLTGLLNRRTFNAQLQGRLREAQRYNRPVSLLLLDVDHFKKVNDTLGHQNGDQVLINLAEHLRSHVRGEDIPCRFGGEEFVVVMPETEIAIGTTVAERIRRRIATEPFTIRDGASAIDVTISIGIAALSGADDQPAAILKRADEALFRAKRDGRNRVAAAEAA